MKRVYFLSSCSTCARIMDQVPDLESWEQIDIKESNILSKDLDLIARQSGGYEAVFSKRARKYRGEGHHEKNLSEKDFRQLILKEYTFLKRPVWIDGSTVFVGNSKKVVNDLLAHVSGTSK